MKKVTDAWWKKLSFSHKTSKQWSNIDSHINFISSNHFLQPFFFPESLPEKVPFSSAFSIDLLWSNLCELREFCGLNSLHLPSSECIGIVKRTQILIVFFLQVPSCLILQMPRFGSRYKMYDMILPNLQLDVTHIVESGMCQLNKYTIKY